MRHMPHAANLQQSVGIYTIFGSAFIFAGRSKACAERKIGSLLKSRPFLIPSDRHLRPWHELGDHVHSLDSTNDELQRRAQWASRQGQVLPEGLHISADYQSKGRGRQGRHWEGLPNQNLAISFLLGSAGLELKQIFTLSQNIALAVAASISYFCPQGRIQIKWPNDIMLNDRKVAGILIETSLQAAEIRYLVAGIGINIHQSIFEKAPRAIGMASLAGPHIQSAEIALNLCNELEFRQKRLAEEAKSGLAADISAAYSAQLWGVGIEGIWLERGEQRRFPATLLEVKSAGIAVLDCEGSISHWSADEIQLVDHPLWRI